MITLNYIGVVVAALATFFLGGFWYSPSAFGSVWMKEMGITKKQVDAAKKSNEPMKSMAWMFVFVVLEAAVLDYFLMWAQLTNNVMGALQIAGILWLGIIVPYSITSVIFEKKSIKMWLINAGHGLVALCLMMGILSWFG